MLLKPYPWKDVNYTNFETSLPVVTKLQQVWNKCCERKFISWKLTKSLDFFVDFWLFQWLLFRKIFCSSIYFLVIQKQYFPNNLEHKLPLKASLNSFLIVAVNTTRLPESQLDLIDVNLNLKYKSRLFQMANTWAYSTPSQHYRGNKWRSASMTFKE